MTLEKSGLKFCFIACTRFLPFLKNIFELRHHINMRLIYTNPEKYCIVMESVQWYASVMSTNLSEGLIFNTTRVAIDISRIGVNGVDRRHMPYASFDIVDYILTQKVFSYESYLCFLVTRKFHLSQKMEY